MKIFGDLHGQFGDLMRLFEEYGTPSTAGDITYIDYLFLGDYVDRGAHSLETICLLLALKLEHPSAVHLIRGNHEARAGGCIFWPACLQWRHRSAGAMRMVPWIQCRTRGISQVRLHVEKGGAGGAGAARRRRTSTRCSASGWSA